MDKTTLLQELAAKVQRGEISSQEVLRTIGSPATEQMIVGSVSPKPASHFSVTKMLYVIGAAIVVIGIVIFVGQIWQDIGAAGRILVTLVLGLLLAAVGSSLLKAHPNDAIGATFHVIGGLLIPGGAMVTLTELSNGSDSIWPVALTFGGIFAFYLLLNTIQKHAVLTFFAIANGTAFVYLLVAAIIGDAYSAPDKIFVYLTMVVGACYLLLGHTFKANWNKSLVGVLYFFGITSFLGAAFSQVFESGAWQMLFVLLLLGGLFLSVNLKSRSILVMSTLFVIAHVSFITSEYFADSLGWPISLVLLGFVFIGLGYGSIAINKQYIQKM